MPAVAGAAQMAASQRIAARMAKLEEIELLVQVGEYRAGSDPLADEALEGREALAAFLRQRGDERSDLGATLAALARIGGAG